MTKPRASSSTTSVSSHKDINNGNHNDDPVLGNGDHDPQDQHTSWLVQTNSFSQSSISISIDGQTVSITISEKGTAAVPPAISTVTVYASLLWVNDPRSIHASSGQRLRSLGKLRSWDDCSIVNAEIVVQNPQLHGPPPTTDKNGNYPTPLPGSMHPRGGIYVTKSSQERRDDDDLLERRLLKVQWTSGEESSFDLQWLIDQCREGRIGWLSTKRAATATLVEDSDENQNSAMEPASLTRVTKDIAIGAIGNPNVRSIPTFDYESVMEDTNDNTLMDAMQEIFEHGAILIQGAPPTDIGDESIVGNLGKLLAGGRLSHGSLYGDIFHVENKSQAENIAYTNVPLPPHQDLTYYESKPFFQLLHCVNDEDGDDRISGGESVLIDAMAAAEELRVFAPDMFNVLCRYEATFLKEREGADMVSPKRHIVTDPTFGQVVEINWSPPFEGPLQLNPRIPLEDYIRAYQAMEFLMDAQQGIHTSEVLSSKSSSLVAPSLECTLREYARTYTWEYALRHGEILVFNNQRMLHGRRGFTTVGRSRRHFIGCYTDAMETISHYRQLLRERRNIVSNNVGSVGWVGRRNAGNGFRWM
jgi:alpha-ketoglutarate-dependent taurine dioxygenase